MNKLPILTIALVALLVTAAGFWLLSPAAPKFSLPGIQVSSVQPEVQTAKEPAGQEEFDREDAGFPSGRFISLSIEQATELSGFLGELLSDHALLGQYGPQAGDTLKQYPKILAAFRRLDPDFSAAKVAVSFPSKVAWFSDETELLVMWGQPRGGAIHVLAYEPRGGRAYLLKENGSRTKVYIYGNPPQHLLALLLHTYLRQ